MQTSRSKLTKQDERRFMTEHAREREEAERNRPVDQRHVDHSWIGEFWQSRGMLS